MTDEPTHVLAEHLASLRLDDVAASAREMATDLLLDAFVCALAADHAEDMAPFASMASAVGGVGSSTIIGRPERASLATTTMTNGFRITAVTACDVYAPAEMHSTPAVVPPALALAEREGATGASLLTAVIAGLETVVRLARSFDRTEYKARGWHSPGVIGPFGGAAAAASILGLDAARTAQALAIAGSQSAGTWAARGSATVKFHQARAAMAGLTSGLLAAEGFEGARRILVAEEGGLYHALAAGTPALVTEAFGAEWALEAISMRLWPGGARVQPTVSAARDLLARTPVVWEDIDRVTVRVAPTIATAQAWAARPESTFAALASIHFTLALTLRDGAAAPARFVADSYGDPELRAFVDERLEVLGDESVPLLGSRVEVVTRDGSVLHGAVDVPRGDPRSRATRDELQAKAHLFGDDRIGRDAVDELIGLVRTIDEQPRLDRVLELVGVPL
jgi:2-methylcitrate dehydratase PrpD